MSVGFMAFEGRKDTSEGLDPSMTTRYYSRLRAVQKLFPLLNNAPSPSVISLLVGGMEGPLNEGDLDMRDTAHWSFGMHQFMQLLWARRRSRGLRKRIYT